MKLFTSTLEKRYWFCSLLVFMAIFSTLFVGESLIRLFTSQDFQALAYILGMALIGITILLHSLMGKTTKLEWVIIIGLIGVYILFFLRLGLAERSHLIEYSVLTIFIHKALAERAIRKVKMPKPAILAFVLSSSIGILDESIQLFLPNRVFDPIDILFNGLAALMAVGGSWLLTLARKKYGK